MSGWVDVVACAGCGSTFAWKQDRDRRWVCAGCGEPSPEECSGRGDVNPGNFAPGEPLAPGTILGGPSGRLAVVVKDGHWKGYGWITVRFLDEGQDARDAGAIKRFFHPFVLDPPEVAVDPRPVPCVAGGRVPEGPPRAAQPVPVGPVGKRPHAHQFPSVSTTESPS